MPELPEVETVKRTLERYVIPHKIEKVSIYYDKILANEEVDSFMNKLQGEKFISLDRRGKWLIFHLENYDLLSHLRMEGKYFLKNREEEINKHEHVIFTLDNHMDLRYQDTRKFGRMYLFEKGKMFTEKPMIEIGKEPWDESLTENYLKEKFQNKKIPIKSVLLDQSIIAGIGNIYANEILFSAKIHPLTLASKLNKKEREQIIYFTQKILQEAISMGGTTIRSYESAKGVHGRFQQDLLVHTKELCPQCHTNIEKIVVGGRGTYYCPNCQKKK